MRLVFNPAKIPRTTTREAWRAMWRWKRECEKRMRKHEAQMIHSLTIYGTTMPPDMKRDLCDRLINPPIVKYPK